ncbi:chitobiase/beta-hexosaminidase C-terminal domain-containing protein [Bacillus timonensis]|uniref:chitobiase/beta-hexosaminidase C-terminal domain-containing protein n=1 Tax=Bacillus timonensis TaxID=1033734 RepID=UPI0002894B60|nr:chitobiase/beta-hexosaminidase C-terminal domain-containing protein [Bacillus timonensis]
MKKSLFQKAIIVMLVSLLLLPLFSLQAFAQGKHGKVSKPESSVISGQYYREQLVELRSATPNVKILYTTDGSDPIKNGHVYTEPILVEKDTTLKTIAVRGNVSSKALLKSKGNTHSDVAVFTFTFVTRETIADQFLSFTYDGMPYRLYVPENYDSSKSYPLVLFLHGGGERGNDNEKQLLANDGAIIWAAPENQAKHQAFVLAPQARNQHDGGFTVTRDSNNIVNLSKVFQFSEDLGKAYEILQHVLQEYNIDRSRLYSTGLSQGGYGTFNLNLKYPDLFAAMVPIAGGGDPAEADKLVDKPIWAFHAEDDGVIPVAHSRNIIAAIKNAGGSPIYTEYPSALGYNHASWVPAYENQEMIEWMFTQVNTK